MTMPKQKPGKSKQDYCTPTEFLDAVKNRLMIPEFSWDLAADAENTVSPFGHFDEATNALQQSWVGGLGLPYTWLWLNPPYSDISPWVQKCAEESAKGAHIAVLVPASVGSNWWRDYVHGQAHVIFLNDRIQFVGAEWVYPKDLALLLFTPFCKGGYEVWKWKQ